MTDAYNDALQEQVKKNIWDTLAMEAKSMSPVEYATIAADLAGIFDPTPISDAVGGSLSLVQGDLIGAGLSVGSFMPYAGDAIAKPPKIAKRAPKTAKLIEQLLRRSDNLATAGKEVLERTFTLSEIAAARKKTLKRVQQAMLEARNKVPGCQDCQKLVDASGTKRVLQMPATGGKWKTVDGTAPASGSGVFTFDSPKTLPDGRVVKEIEFRNGAPNFDGYVEGQKYDLWEVSGNAQIDGQRLKKQMREHDPKWVPQPEDEFVLHHFEDGTVGYVPRALHDKVIGGVSHTGGNSMINNKLF